MSTQYRSAFVSSTYKDLKNHRAHVIDQLRHCGIHVDPMEDWDAAPDEPKVFSTKRIEGCDLFVLLVGNRLGYIPKGEVRSITQLEYDHAVKLGIEILPFMLTKQSAFDDTPDKPYMLDEQDTDPTVEAWRQEIGDRYGVGFFSQPAESVPVATSVARLLVSRQLPLPTSLSLSAILADPARSRDVREFFAGRFDLVKLAFVDHFGRQHVVPDFTIGTMQFDYAVIEPVPGFSNMPPSITYIRLHDPEDKLLDGPIGETLDAVDRFLDRIGDQPQAGGKTRSELIEESLAAREDYRDLAFGYFAERALIVGGRRNLLSKKELEIMRGRNAEFSRLQVKTWDSIAEHLEGLLATAQSSQRS